MFTQKTKVYYYSDKNIRTGERMRRIPVEAEKAIIQRLLDGASYREIQREFDVSLSTVNRVAEDARAKRPNWDELIKLSVTLKKHKLNVLDVLRGVKLLETLGKYAISLSQMEFFLNMIEKILSEKGLENECVAYATKLMQLETESGKSYEEVVSDFEKKLSETVKLDRKHSCRISENKVLQKENLELKLDSVKTEKAYAKAISRLIRLQPP